MQPHHHKLIDCVHSVAAFCMLALNVKSSCTFYQSSARVKEIPLCTSLCVHQSLIGLNFTEQQRIGLENSSSGLHRPGFVVLWPLFAVLTVISSSLVKATVPPTARRQADHRRQNLPGASSINLELTHTHTHSHSRSLTDNHNVLYTSSEVETSRCLYLWENFCAPAR